MKNDGICEKTRFKTIKFNELNTLRNKQESYINNATSFISLLLRLLWKPVVRMGMTTSIELKN